MLLSAKLDFRVDLTSLNTISPQTQAAEKLIRDVWGDVTNRVYLAVEGKTILRSFREKEDRLADLLEDEIARETVAAAFVPSLLFPGEELAKRNFTAWKAFWTPERVDRLRKDVSSTSPRIGLHSGGLFLFICVAGGKILSSTVDPVGLFSPFWASKTGQAQAGPSIATIQPGRAYQGNVLLPKGYFTRAGQGL